MEDINREEMLILPSEAEDIVTIVNAYGNGEIIQQCGDDGIYRDVSKLDMTELVTNPRTFRVFKSVYKPFTMSRQFIKLRAIAYCGKDCHRIVDGNDCDLPATVCINTHSIDSIEEYNHTFNDSGVDYDVHSLLILRGGDCYYYVNETLDEVYKLIAD